MAKIKKSNDLGKGVFDVEGIGKTNAHYNPQKQLINLNRGRKGNYREVLKGENSFVHEYGHFIDVVVGRADQRIAMNFSREN